MAKKKAGRRKPQPSPLLSRLQGTLRKVQRDGEAVLGRVRKEVGRLSADQKKSMNRVVTEAQRLRRDFQKAVKQTATDLESRSKRFLTTLEKNANRRLQVLVARLDPASQQDVQKLARRITELERLVKQHSHPETIPAPLPEPREPADATVM